MSVMCYQNDTAEKNLVAEMRMSSLDEKEDFWADSNGGSAVNWYELWNGIKKSEVYDQELLDDHSSRNWMKWAYYVLLFDEHNIFGYKAELKHLEEKCTAIWL